VGRETKLPGASRSGGVRVSRLAPGGGEVVREGGVGMDTGAGAEQSGLPIRSAAWALSSESRTKTARPVPV